MVWQTKYFQCIYNTALRSMFSWTIDRAYSNKTKTLFIYFALEPFQCTGRFEPLLFCHGIEFICKFLNFEAIQLQYIFNGSVQNARFENDCIYFSMYWLSNWLNSHSALIKVLKNCVKKKKMISHKMHEFKTIFGLKKEV